ANRPGITMRITSPNANASNENAGQLVGQNNPRYWGAHHNPIHQIVVNADWPVHYHAIVLRILAWAFGISVSFMKMVASSALSRATVATKT
ncbi:MAG: hypothetical protein ABL921_12650, partial [Pirellula sp.]